VIKTLNQYLKTVIPEEHSWKIDLLKNWGKIIGKFKDKVMIEKIHQDLLILGVCHPAWAQELFLKSENLRRKINKILKEEKIKKIQFRFVNFDLLEKGRKERHSLNCFNNQISSKKTNLTQSESKQLKKIKDKILQDALKEFYLCCKESR